MKIAMFSTSRETKNIIGFIFYIKKPVGATKTPSDSIIMIIKFDRFSSVTYELYWYGRARVNGKTPETLIPWRIEHKTVARCFLLKTLRIVQAREAIAPI